MLERVVLTSFEDSRYHGGRKYSVARWQPKGYKYHELPFLAPFDVQTGKALVHLEPVVYRQKYEQVLLQAREPLRAFVGNCPEVEVVFCCWCDPGRQAGYEKLYCHTILIGYLLEEMFPALEIEYADGRDKPIWERTDF